MGAPVENLGGTAIKPEGWDRTGWESFKFMLWDPKTGAILTRTPGSWAKIILFYCIYYSLLAGFWIGCLQMFFLTLPENEPRWTLDGSLIGKNPGVGLRPGTSDDKIDSSMYLLNSLDNSDAPTSRNGEGEKNVDFARRMQLFMEKYDNNTGLNTCTGVDDPNRGKCVFDRAVLGPCASYPYGFKPVNGNIAPCLFLKLNKIWNLVPESIDPANLDAPEYEKMSQGLKNKIKAAGETNNIFFDCQGRYAADREGMTMEYFPANQAISLKYFPFSGGNYQSPLVAVKITPSVKGQLIHIECRAWYKGIVHDTKDKVGLTQFEVMVV